MVGGSFALLGAILGAMWGVIGKGRDRAESVTDGLNKRVSEIEAEVKSLESSISERKDDTAELKADFKEAINIMSESTSAIDAKMNELMLHLIDSNSRGDHK